MVRIDLEYVDSWDFLNYPTDSQVECGGIGILESIGNFSALDDNLLLLKRKAIYARLSRLQSSST